jgi:hypothetical protein
MVITITEFQRDLFSLVESAVQGEVVEFVHNGLRFRLVLESETTEPARQTLVQKPAATKADIADMMDATQQMSEEVKAALRRKWAEQTD